MDYQDVLMRFLTEQSLWPAQIARFFNSHPNIKPDVHVIADMLYNRDNFSGVGQNMPKDLAEILANKPFASDAALSDWLQNASKILEILKTREIFAGIKIPEEQVKWALGAFIKSCPFVPQSTKEKYISEIEKPDVNDSDVQNEYLPWRQAPRNEFKAFMQLQGFKPTTITLYISLINQISANCGTPLWGIKDIESLHNILPNIYNNPNFPKKKTSKYYSYVAALTQYEAFLRNKKIDPTNRSIVVKTNSRPVGEDRHHGATQNDNANLVAFCFSCGHEALFPNLNQTKAFEKAAEILEINVKTLQNMRNYFDYYIEDSGRKGWQCQKSLVEKHKIILDKYLAHSGDGKYSKKGCDKKLADAYAAARKILKLE